MPVRAFLLSAWDTLITLSGAAAAAFGGWSPDIRLLAGLMLADYLTGVLCALLHKSKHSKSGGLSASAGFKGLLKKAAIPLVLFVSALADGAAGGGTSLKNMTTGFYICNEGVSVLENLACMGVPVPKVVRNALDVMRSRNDKDELK